MALNVDLDLEPFSRIDPCGYRALKVTRLKDLGLDIDCAAVANALLPKLVGSLYGEECTVDFSLESGAVLDRERGKADWPGTIPNNAELQHIHGN